MKLSTLSESKSRILKAFEFAPRSDMTEFESLTKRLATKLTHADIKPNATGIRRIRHGTIYIDSEFNGTASSDLADYIQSQLPDGFEISEISTLSFDDETNKKLARLTSNPDFLSSTRSEQSKMVRDELGIDLSKLTEYDVYCGVRATRSVEGSLPDITLDLWYSSGWHSAASGIPQQKGKSNTAAIVVANNRQGAEELASYYYLDYLEMVREVPILLNKNLDKLNPEEAFDYFNAGKLGWRYNDSGDDLYFEIVPPGDPKYGGRAHMIHAHPAKKLAKTLGLDIETNFDIVVLYKPGQNITPPSEITD